MAEDARASTSGKKGIGGRTPDALEEHLKTLLEGEFSEVFNLFEREPAAPNEAVTLLRSTLRALEGGRLDKDDAARRIVRARRIADLLLDWARCTPQIGPKTGVDPAPLRNLRSALRAAPTTALREEHLGRIRDAHSGASEAFESIREHVGRRVEWAHAIQTAAEDADRWVHMASADAMKLRKVAGRFTRKRTFVEAVREGHVEGMRRPECPRSGAPRPQGVEVDTRVHPDAPA